MGQPKSTRTLRRRQLDQQLSRIDRSALAPPPGGWVRNLRDALGINGRQLCERIGISRGFLSQIEKAELTWTTTMKTLSRVADGMECDLVYALVPRAGSLDGTLQQRAVFVATRLVDRVAASMALEQQRTDPRSRKQLIDSTAAELVRTFDKTLWEEPR